MSDKFRVNPEDLRMLKSISANCGSKSVKEGHEFIRLIYFRNPEACRLSLYPEVGFWFGSITRSHFRLIEFAVRKDKQGKGYGRLLYRELCEFLRSIGLSKITLRTSMYEPAINFWEKVADAKVVGMKKDDYELEINLENP